MSERSFSVSAIFKLPSEHDHCRFTTLTQLPHEGLLIVFGVKPTDSVDVKSTPLFITNESAEELRGLLNEWHEEYREFHDPAKARRSKKSKTSKE